MAARHYEAHVERPFFSGLVEFITSSPIVAMVLQGPNVVDITRKTMGATNPVDAAPGTIRGDLGINIGRNLIHGSDSFESAQREIDLFFSPPGDCGLPQGYRPLDYRTLTTWVAPAHNCSRR